MSSLSADVEELIRREMSRGTYADENELLRMALEAWADQRAMVAAVQEGIDDAEAGRTQPWRPFLDDLRERKGLPRAE